MIAKTFKHWQSHLAALTTALTLSLTVGSAQAVNLPAPGYEVDGFAIFYSSLSIAQAADTNQRVRTGSYYDFDNLSDITPWLNAVEPVFDVTGVDLDNLPVPFLNQLDSLSLSGASNNAWRLDLTSRREATLSNLVLDIRTMTLWGDLQVKVLSGSQAGLIGSRLAFPILKPSDEFTPIALEYRPGNDPDISTYWWPENAPFAQPAQISSLDGYFSGLPYAGLHHFAGMGPNAALIWLPSLQFTAEAHALGAFSPPGGLGNMLIAVQVSAVPEAETQALAVIGLLLVGAAVHRRGRHRG